MNTPRELLTPAETCEFLRIGNRTLIRWRNARIGPAWLRVGGRILYHRDDLKSWLKEQRVEPVRNAS